MAAPVFVAQHPRSVYQIMRQAYRTYLASGNAAGIDVTTVPNHTAASTTTVAGTVYVDTSAGVVMPATVSVILTQSATTKGTQAAPVNPATGAYTTTFPGATLTAGTATATVTSTSPAKSTTSNTFTLT